ncbi:hypothetical protein RJT34_11883 [Clitoria ternatea]|uniref:Uncharacterized protein n=1 Tax=Clitoria ternatea TaxID=43366 RepID=A0AAN9JL87_CLITE
MIVDDDAGLEVHNDGRVMEKVDGESWGMVEGGICEKVVVCPHHRMATHTATNVVFVDTNLDTHLALDVSDLETVSGLKKSILSEHPLCFPKFGQIQIHGIKVKRKGYFYHLSDSMLVKSAFTGSNKSWFLSVDAFALGECAQNEQSFSHGSPNPIGCLGVANNALIGHGDNTVSFPSKRVSTFDNLQLPQLENKQDKNDEMHVVSPRVSQHTGDEALENVDAGVKLSGHNDTGNPLPGSGSGTEEHCFVNHEPSGLRMECEVDGSGKSVKDDRNVCEEYPLISMPSEKKKRKSKRKNGDMVQDDNSKDATASVGNPLSFPSKRDMSFQALQLENKQDEIEEIPVPEHAGEVVKNLEMEVNSSGNNDPGILETKDHCCVNRELPDSRVEHEVDGTNEGNKDACVEFEGGNSESLPKAKKKKKSKRKKENTMQDDASKEDDASVVVPGNYTVQQDVVVIANPSENADKELIKETEVLKYNTKNDIDTDVSMKEASEPGSTTSKKSRKRKRTLALDSKEISEVETSSQKGEVQKSDEAHREKKEPKDQCELDSQKSRDGVENEDKKTAEDILDPRSPAKKKRSKEKSGEKSLSRAKLINDFNVDNASHHSLEDQQKIENSSAGTDPLRTSVQSRKRKVKRNSSNHHETPVVTSRKDEVADCSSIQSRVVQEQISEDVLLSKDVSMSKTIINNMENGTDACKESIQSTEKRTGTCKNLSDIEMKVHPSDPDEHMELTVDNENADLDHSHKNEAGQIEGAKEGNKASPQKSIPPNQDNTDTNSTELNVTSKVVDVNGMTEPVKSEKHKRGMRKAKNSGEPTSREGNTKADENLLNQTEGKRIQHKEMHMEIEPSDSWFNSESNGAAQCSPCLPGKEDDNNLEAPSKTFKVNTDQQFSSQEQQHEANLSDDIPVDKMDRTNVETMTGKNKHGLEATNGQTHAKGLRSSQRLTSKEEHDVLRTHPDKKVTNVHRTGKDSKLSGRSDNAMSSIGENRKAHVNTPRKSVDLEKQREHISISNSKLEGRKKMVQNKSGKASGNNVRGAPRKTQQKKSLLAGAIFKDDGSSTSDDEVDNSDASTRTPSDNPLLSDSSDEDNSSGLHSRENGLKGGDSLENGGRNSRKSSLSSMKGMSIDRVLRSSSRFKKAKTTASQLEETESEPEFVPDSLPH